MTTRTVTIDRLGLALLTVTVSAETTIAAAEQMVGSQLYSGLMVDGRFIALVCTKFLDGRPELAGQLADAEAELRAAVAELAAPAPAVSAQVAENLTLLNFRAYTAVAEMVTAGWPAAAFADASQARAAVRESVGDAWTVALVLAAAEQLAAPRCELCEGRAVLVGEQWTCPACAPIGDEPALCCESCGREIEDVDGFEADGLMVCGDCYAPAAEQAEALALAEQLVGELNQLDGQIAACLTENRDALANVLCAAYDATSARVRALGYEIGPVGDGTVCLWRKDNTGSLNAASWGSEPARQAA